MKIYLKSPDNSRIIEFQNENEVGAGFIGWQPAAEQQITTYLLDKAKTSKLAEIKQVKDMKLYEPVFYMNKYFVASERASSNIMGSILLDENTKWLDIDGNPINMTKQQMMELANAIKNQRGKIYFIEAQQSKAVENAKTIDDINKIIVNY